MKAIVCLILWLGCGIVGAGFYNASVRAVYHNGVNSHDAKQVFAMSMFFAVSGPVLLMVGFALSGMGDDGWTLSWQPMDRAGQVPR